MPSKSYVTGIDKNIDGDRYIHLIYFDPLGTESLYYMKFDISKTDDATDK